MISVSGNNRYLMDEAGKPFFWLGDTAWELFHRMDKVDIEAYLADRAVKGFTVIQTVCLGEMDGLITPNRYGRVPLLATDPMQPDDSGDYSYWHHIDWAIEKAASFGLQVALLPTWGRYVQSDCFNGIANGIFTPENALVYGQFIGERYGRCENVIWVLGGDRLAATAEVRAIWNSMARGIALGARGNEDYSDLLMTYHPPGPCSSASHLHNEGWMSLNMTQSGHASKDVTAAYEMITDAWLRKPTKPVLDGEINYEDIPVGFSNDTGEVFNDYDVRRQAYRTVFAGGCGVTYGHNSIWQAYTPGRTTMIDCNMTWLDALHRPGAGQLRYLRRLMLSRPYFSRVPDQTIVSWAAKSAADHVQATRDVEGGYAFIYIPRPSQEVRVALRWLSCEVARAWWYCPRTGEAKYIGSHSASGGRELAVLSPWDGQDVVLVVDDEAQSRAYPAPGASEYSV